jgi:hypothetical protein
MSQSNFPFKLFVLVVMENEMKTRLTPARHWRQSACFAIVEFIPFFCAVEMQKSKSFFCPITTQAQARMKGLNGFLFRFSIEIKIYLKTVLCLSLLRWQIPWRPLAVWPEVFWKRRPKCSKIYPVLTPLGINIVIKYWMFDEKCMKIKSPLRIIGFFWMAQCRPKLVTLIAGKKTWSFETWKRFSSSACFHPCRKNVCWQGCQIFLGTTYQNGKNIPNYHKI